jgi:hypothetical protein
LLFDVLDQGVAMHRFPPKRLEHHHLQCSGEQAPFFDFLVSGYARYSALGLE